MNFGPQACLKVLYYLNYLPNPVGIPSNPDFLLIDSGNTCKLLKLCKFFLHTGDGVA